LPFSFADVTGQKCVLRGDETDWAAFGGREGFEAHLRGIGATLLAHMSARVCFCFLGSSEHDSAWVRKNSSRYPARLVEEADLPALSPDVVEAPAQVGSKRGRAKAESSSAVAEKVAKRKPRGSASLDLPKDDAAEALVPHSASAAGSSVVPEPAAAVAADVVAYADSAAAGAGAGLTGSRAQRAGKKGGRAVGSTEAVCGGLSPSQLAYAGGSFPLPPAGVSRAKPWRSSPSQATLERTQRANQQRMFLVDRRLVGAAGGSRNVSVEFHVLGSTGNVYRVMIGRDCYCTCPDYLRSKCCKHMIFVMLKVLRVPAGHPFAFNVSFLPNELLYIMDHSPDPAGAGGVLAPDEAREAIAKATGRTLAIAAAAADSAAAACGGSSSSSAAAVPAAGAAAAAPPARKPHDPSDDCPICFDSLGASLPALCQCSTCSNYLHTECMTNWLKAKVGQPATCVFCRAPWRPVGGAASSSSSGAGAAAAGAGGVSRVGGYLNVAGLAGLSGRRDTSTYHGGGGWFRTMLLERYGDGYDDAGDEDDEAEGY